MKTTKSKLISSLMILTLCVTMFAGSTYAWFTDEVVSAGNKIVAGNLDVQLLMYTDADTAVEITDATNPIFGAADSLIAQNDNSNTLWEPGKTQVAYLAIKNNGNLALKYNVNLETKNETKNMHEAMQYAITPDATFGTVTSWDVTKAQAAKLGVEEVADYTKLGVGETHYFALSVHMKEEAGNEYMDAQIEFDIKLFATQLNSEEDAFGPDYDELAPKSLVSSYGDFDWGNGGKYALSDDITVGEQYAFYFKPGTKAEIDLNEKKIEGTIDVNHMFVSQGSGSSIELSGNGVVDMSADVGTGYMFFVSNSGNITVNGGEYYMGERSGYKEGNMFAQNNGTLVINGGKFITDDPDTALAYCINGFIEINGGFFQNRANPNQALLSCGNNLAYANNQKITLSGGTFVNWNPMDSAFAQDWPQSPATIVLADGYKMTSVTQSNGDVWYMVVEE